MMVIQCRCRLSKNSFFLLRSSLLLSRGDFPIDWSSGLLRKDHPARQPPDHPTNLSDWVHQPFGLKKAECLSPPTWSRFLGVRDEWLPQSTR